ncbi:proline-specific peptidase [Multifurca ochricompacta]|uniref:Proline-specific peptidase n=1 Tax=Multifurca ochricompacta TaxID=376703 RepID=A0AAD4M534_9AGAM|nr:proline-specific peptidase [Multifurca ochricompacta]
MATSTGTAPYLIGSETFHTSYKVVGNLKGGKRPVVIIHGGPGLTFAYMIPHANLFKTHGIPVILYDQLGGGLSSSLKDKHPEFIKPALFVAELDSLVKHLGIDHDFDIIAQSWGVTLAVEYVAKHRPLGLKHLVLTDGSASYPLWREGLANLRKQWPQDFQDILNRHEKDGTIDAPEYQQATMKFYQKHILNLKEWPPETLESMGQMHKDPTVYNALIGANEFNMTGSLKDWSVIPLLGSVKCPTLVINGVDDEVPDICVEPLFHGIKNARWVTFGASSHMPFWEEPEKYTRIVGDFLTDAGGIRAQSLIARIFQLFKFIVKTILLRFGLYPPT